MDENKFEKQRQKKLLSGKQSDRKAAMYRIRKNLLFF